MARLSPLKDRNINFLGRYQFNVTVGGPAGAYVRGWRTSPQSSRRPHMPQH
ncbi:hypothetical protein ABT010_17715 [Streptomyces sp. NPDC002668]|uniref:hypothetical protein n=1 Tax=Streptomyces sp. NPDC002668 TaxID=3154422 RepID=UPI00331D3125